MKKSSIISLTSLLVLSVGLTSCGSKQESTEKEILRVYNWQDYINEGDDETLSVIDQFEVYYKNKYNKEIEVEYYTFETNENMLNVLRTGKSQYDLVCPSDYVIQKMIKEGMLEKFDAGSVPNYDSYGATYIKDLFARNKVTVDGVDHYWNDYAVPYMWGTMGFMYNPENVDEDDIKSWSILWDEEYKYKATLKDAVRDTYVAAAMYVFKDELKALNEQYKAGFIDANEYSSLVSGYMNSTTDESIEKIENALNEAKKNAYGFEVDSGKSDIVTGKIDINFCWSGDAVYALDCAEEESDMYLNYYVPEEGSNVWFDGWVMPKGANKDLAQEFVNFLCDPKISVQNMDYIGYTSAIAGQDIFDLVVDWYGVKTRDYYSDEEWAELNEEEKEEVFEDEEALLDAYENEEIYKVDLSYLFEGTIDGEAVVYTYELNRQFSAQYPSYETIIRCAVMEDFGKDNEKVISMWIRVKSDEVPVWIWVFLGTSIVLVAAYFISKTASKKIRNDRIKEKRKLEKLAAKQK